MNPIWNAHVEVGTANQMNTVGLGWGVTDDVTGVPLDYHALITLTLPPSAVASVRKQSPNETVVLAQDAALACGPDGIEATVTYRVSPHTAGATGREVVVNIADNAGQKPPPTGGVLGTGAGQVGQDITVGVVIPGSCGQTAT
jgi:hypothetical protein